MDFELLKKAFKEVKPELDALSNFFEGGMCVIATRLAYNKLKEFGFDDLKVVGGKALFSVNTGNNGLLDYGYGKNSYVGNYIGHYWLTYKDTWVIDFTLPYLKNMFLRDNNVRGIRDNRFLLDKNQIFIPMVMLSSYDALYQGKIGHHYLEIPNRGETLWLDSIPEL